MIFLKVFPEIDKAAVAAPPVFARNNCEPLFAALKLIAFCEAVPILLLLMSSVVVTTPLFNIA